ncbi:hypothetical protein PR048_007105 [Dryococelus australis]|uniref:DDE-1 domain-containing protein n=1 Tax=Dryococelus australis TaxID=614101 RepID=A0ABQ9ICU0_9NEOP|nr:hypothetical protein PR048_007105 [Dryococelus australis]
MHHVMYSTWRRLGCYIICCERGKLSWGGKYSKANVTVVLFCNEDGQYQTQVSGYRKICHTKMLQGSAIKNSGRFKTGKYLIAFPASNTSVLQPLNQGIIQCLKRKYRVRLVKYLICQCENKGLTVLDSICNICVSWDDIIPETIKNCFVKSGLG